MSRPLWQLLLAASKAENTEPLTCDECFAVLGYLADLIDFGESERQLVHDLLQQHLAVCPDCHTYYLQKLTEWEEVIRINSSNE